MAKKTKKTNEDVEVKPTVTVLQGNLADGLSKVARAVAARSTLPILGNVLLEMDGGRLKLSATNLEVSVTCWIGAMGDKDFRTTLPAKTLTDVTKALSGTLELQLNPKTQTTTIKAGRFKNNVKGFDADEFPMLPTSNNDLCVIDGNSLLQIIKRVVPAAAKDESRPILTGVAMDFGDKVLTAAAADGFRLAMDATPIDRDCRVEVAEKQEPRSFIVPARTLAELARIIKADDMVTVKVNHNTLLFVTDFVVLTTQIIDGKFPPYTAIIPKSSAVSVSVDRAELIKAVKAASVFARDAANITIFDVKPAENMGEVGTLVVSAHAAETGETEGRIDARVTGYAVSIAFNSRYILDVLSVLASNDVTIGLNDASKPGLITEGSFTFVVMPMHVAGREEAKQVNTEGEEVEPQPDPEPEEIVEE